MALSKINVGLIGANADKGWAAGTHLPALAALDMFALNAVCTTRIESARDTAARFGARHAVDDPARLVALDDVDLVVVSVRAPLHAAMVRLALDAGKAVLCEWPLGRNAAESTALRDLAAARGLRGFVDLQGRFSPAIRQMRDMIAQGYAGELLGVTMTAHVAPWGETVAASTAYLIDADNGVTLPSIIGGHAIDMLAAVCGALRSVSAQIANRIPTARSIETGEVMAKTAPDQLMAIGELDSGVPVALHLQGGTRDSQGFRLEIRGTAGTLILSSPSVPEILPPVLHGTQEAGGEPQPIPADPRYRTAPPALGEGPAVNVAELYRQLARDLREGTCAVPDFAHAARHRARLDAIAESARAGRRLAP